MSKRWEALRSETKWLRHSLRMIFLRIRDTTIVQERAVFWPRHTHDSGLCCSTVHLQEPPICTYNFNAWLAWHHVNTPGRQKRSQKMLERRSHRICPRGTSPQEGQIWSLRPSFRNRHQQIRSSFKTPATIVDCWVLTDRKDLPKT